MKSSEKVGKQALLEAVPSPFALNDEAVDIALRQKPRRMGRRGAAEAFIQRSCVHG